VVEGDEIMKTALLQMDIVLGDVAANQRKAQILMEEAVAGGAK
jgi:predicted amidohydrolase